MATARPPPLGMGSASQHGAFFNYMGMGQLPKGALSQLQNSDTANWMAGLSSPAGSASQRGQPAPQREQPAHYSAVPFPEPEPTWRQPPRQPSRQQSRQQSRHGADDQPLSGQPSAQEQLPSRPLSLPAITSPARGSGVYVEEPENVPSGRASAAADFGSSRLVPSASSSEDRPIVSRQSILSRGSRRQSPARGSGSAGLNDTGAEFWSDENSRKHHRRIKCTVDQAIEMIRSKITERMDGRAGWLRRAFVDFDTDASGSISPEEFIAAVEFKTALVFDEEVLRGVMDRFDDDGTGEINFNKFVRLVMGSSARDSTALKTGTLKGDASYESADSGNSAIMLRRKIRMGAKDIRRAFKDLDRNGSGLLSYEDLRYALHRMDIDLNDRQFEDLMRQIDHNGDGIVSYAEFLDFFHREDPGLGLKEIKGVTVDQAIEIIREKINVRLDSRPGALNRAFQQMDADGSGAIDIDEFKKALLMKGGLIFDDAILRKVMDKFDDDGTGEIDFRKFCTFVMGSTSRDATGIKTNIVDSSSTVESADSGNSAMMLRRKIRMGAKDIRRAFKDLDRNGSGRLSYEDLRYALHRMDIDLNDRQFEDLMKQIDLTGSQSISYAEFLDFFHREDEGLGLKKMTSVTVDQAIEIIREKIGEKMDSRPGALNRAFQQMDADGSGAIDIDEFKKALL
eukprot:COSAG02_NODE_3961_length_5981_cov_175.988949_1_plen_680_part_10